MVIKSKCQLVAVSHITTNVSKPEALWMMRHAKYRLSRYNNLEWWWLDE